MTILPLCSIALGIVTPRGSALFTAAVFLAIAAALMVIVEAVYVLLHMVTIGARNVD